jgi:hypothetical protein
MKDFKPIATKFGAPTKYTEDMPQIIVDYMAQGNSVIQFAALVGIHKDTLYEWANKYPDFSDAFRRARILCESFWEKKYAKALDDKTVNSTLYKFYMSARFGWSEKTENKLSGTITHESALDDLSDE